MTNINIHSVHSSQFSLDIDIARHVNRAPKTGDEGAF